MQDAMEPFPVAGSEAGLVRSGRHPCEGVYG